MDKQTKIIIKLIGNENYTRIISQIPSEYQQEIIHPINIFIESLSSKALLETYIAGITKRPIQLRQTILGEFISISSLLEILILQLAESRYQGINFSNFSLHNMLIILAHLDINTEENIKNIFMFKHIRNIIAHRHQEMESLSTSELLEAQAQGIFACYLAKDIKDELEKRKNDETN